MKIEPEKRERGDVGTVEKKKLLREKNSSKRLADETQRLRAKIQILLEKIDMRRDPILKDAAEFRKRLLLGEEKFLSAEDSAKWRESVRRQRDVITKQLGAQLEK
jgi:hypothetical protein